MKTRPRGEGGTPGLPPPPAPTARDANPWPLSTPPPAAPPLRLAPTGDGRPAVRHPRATPTAGRRRRSRAMPALVLFTVLGIGVGLAVEALQSGRVEDAIGALLVLAFVAVMAWRTLKRGQ